MGLKNVRARIEARYPKQGNIRANAEEDSFRVDLSIPAETAGSAVQTAASEAVAQPVAIAPVKEVRS